MRNRIERWFGILKGSKHSTTTPLPLTLHPIERFLESFIVTYN